MEKGKGGKKNRSRKGGETLGEKEAFRRQFERKRISVKYEIKRRGVGGDALKRAVEGRETGEQ